MSGRVIVTDHALVRYLDRVGGFEMERLRGEIAARLQPFVGSGCSAVIIDGHAYLINHNPQKGPVLITVLPAGGNHRPMVTGPEYT